MHLMTQSKNEHEGGVWNTSLWEDIFDMTYNKEVTAEVKTILYNPHQI